MASMLHRLRGSPEWKDSTNGAATTLHLWHTRPLCNYQSHPPEVGALSCTSDGPEEFLESGDLAWVKFLGNPQLFFFVPPRSAEAGC